MTNRMLVVSVACMRLSVSSDHHEHKTTSERRDLLRVHAQLRAVGLHEAPQDIFRSLVDVEAGGVLGEVLFERNLQNHKEAK
jgi:hypothetical protein